jgi:hypothetical protein
MEREKGGEGERGPNPVPNGPKMLIKLVHEAYMFLNITQKIL